MQLRYLDADVSGWQGYVDAQAVVEGEAKAVAPDADNLVGLNESRAAGFTLLDQIGAQSLSPKEQGVLAAVRGQWSAYFVVTDRMLALIRAATPASMSQAYDLLNGDLDTAWSALLDSTSALQGQVGSRTPYDPVRRLPGPVRTRVTPVRLRAVSDLSSLVCEPRDMLVLVIALVLCVALGSAVVAVVAMPARREGRDILSPRGGEVFDKVKDAAVATKDRTSGMLSRKDDDTV